MDQATKFIIASVVAAPALDQLGATSDPANVDCLAGVWARDAAERIGPVPTDRYGLAIQGTRRIAEARASWWAGGPAMPGGRDQGSTAEREPAFRRGYAAGVIGAPATLPDADLATPSPTVTVDTGQGVFDVWVVNPECKQKWNSLDDFPLYAWGQ
mgnify:CR=1 FL=1